MKKLITIITVLCLISLFYSCEQAVSGNVDNSTTIKWMGTYDYPPYDPEPGSAYYNSTDGVSYIWDGELWNIIAKDGAKGEDGSSIIWVGEFSEPPFTAEKGHAYYNLIDGNSYIFNGIDWDYLAKSGRDGSSGILLWLGSLDGEPAFPDTGWAYYSTIDKTSYVWDGDSWEVIARDGTNGTNGLGIYWLGVFNEAPDNPSLNDAYYNTTDLATYIWNGSKWDTIAISAGGDTHLSINISWKGEHSSAPTTPAIGWAYYNTTDSMSYIWDGTTWQIMAKDGYSPTGYLVNWRGSYPTAPSSPEKGWMYYNSGSGRSYIWDGFNWQMFAKDGVDGVDGNGSTSTAANSKIEILYNDLPISYFDFNNIYYGDSHQIVTFTVKNYGTDTLELTGDPVIGYWGNKYSNDSNFIIDTSNTNRSIMPGESTTFKVEFAPDMGNSYTGQLVIYNNSGNSSKLLYVYGNCYSPGLSLNISLNGYNYTENPSYSTKHFENYGFSKVDFGDVTVGEEVETFYIIISNSWTHTKNTTLLLNGSSAIEISGPDSDSFIITQPLKTSFNYKEEDRSSKIVFKPTSLGIKNATITIKTNSPNRPVFSFEVTGNCKRNEVVITPETKSWLRSFDGGEGDGNDEIVTSVIDSSNNIYFVGYGHEIINNHSNSDWWIKKFNSNGEEDITNWDNKIDFNSTSDKPTNALIGKDDNLYVSDDYNTIKFSPDGVELFRINNGGKIFEDSKGYLYIYDSYDAKKYSMEGVELFTINEGGELTEDKHGNIHIEDGFYRYIYNDSGIQKYEMYDYGTIKKYLSDGSIDWNENYSGLYIKSITLDVNDNVYIAGRGTDLFDEYSSYDVWIRKISAEGVEDFNWDKKYDWGNSNSEYATKININEDGYVYIFGDGYDLISNISAWDYWEKRYTIDGTEDLDYAKVLDYKLNKNYLRILDDGTYYIDSGSEVVKYSSNNVKLYSVSHRYIEDKYTYSSKLNVDALGNIYIYGSLNNLVNDYSSEDWFIKKIDVSDQN